MGRIGLALAVACAAVAAQDGIRSSIVEVYATTQQPRYVRPWDMTDQSQGGGSGCIIEGRRILTSAHVVANQTFVQVRRAGTADKVVATVRAVSHELDIAILGVADPAFFAGAPPVPLGELPAVGDSVRVLGYPTGGTRLTLTEGIVSRIDRHRYSHSSLSNLVCQIDAAINAGASGGPVVAEGRLVGVAFEAGGGEDIGYMVPVPVVRHFLADLEDGRLHGTPALPVRWQRLENPHLRAHYRVPAGRSGVLLTAIAPRFEGDDKLKPRDVLLGIDGLPIANDGTVEFRPGERIDFRHLVDRKQTGESLEIRLLRAGTPVDLVLPLPVAKAEYGHLVPRTRYDRRPEYFVVGGLVFAPLVMERSNAEIVLPTEDLGPRSDAILKLYNVPSDRLLSR